MTWPTPCSPIKKSARHGSQARCREMEREIETLTTCGCEGCDDNLEESAFCLPCMNKAQQQVAQLQATLAALVQLCGAAIALHNPVMGLACPCPRCSPR